MAEVELVIMFFVLEDIESFWVKINFFLNWLWKVLFFKSNICLLEKDIENIKDKKMSSFQGHLEKLSIINEEVFYLYWLTRFYYCLYLIILL